MDGFVGLLMGLGVFVLIILLLRLFGAWMLRIDEVIKHQKEILNELKKGNTLIENTTSKKENTTTNRPEVIRNKGTIQLPKNYKSITIKHVRGGQEETISQKQWEKLMMKYGIHTYTIINYESLDNTD